jgi:hypothetical protein
VNTGSSVPTAPVDPHPCRVSTRPSDLAMGSSMTIVLPGLPLKTAPAGRRGMLRFTGTESERPAPFYLWGGQDSNLWPTDHESHSVHDGAAHRPAFVGPRRPPRSVPLGGSAPRSRPAGGCPRCPRRAPSTAGRCCGRAPAVRASTPRYTVSAVLAIAPWTPPACR